MVNKKTDIKASIILKTDNNDKFLYEIFESIKEFDEIIVLDYQSNDESLEIAKEYKAKIIHCNKNDCSALDYVIEQSVNDWILVLDKNEILPLNLFNKISKIIEEDRNIDENIKKNKPKKIKNIFSIGRKSFYLNKEIKLLKENKIRFFKKGFCTLNYDFTVSIKDTSIESNINLKNENLKIYYINKNFKEKNEYLLNFIDNNISILIQDIINKNKNTLKSAQKCEKPSIIIKPMMKFLKYYLLKGGMLEGASGFLFCKMKYFENLILQTMIQEKNFKGEKYDI